MRVVLLIGLILGGCGATQEPETAQAASPAVESVDQAAQADPEADQTAQADQTAEADRRAGDETGAMWTGTLPAFAQSSTPEPLPRGAARRYGTSAFRVLDPGPAVQLFFREDRLLLGQRYAREWIMDGGLRDRGALRLRDIANGALVSAVDLPGAQTERAFRSRDGQWTATCISERSVVFYRGERTFRFLSPAPRPSGSGGLGGMIPSGVRRPMCASFTANAERALIYFQDGNVVQQVDLSAGTARTVDQECRRIVLASDGEHFLCDQRLMRADGSVRTELAHRERFFASTLAMSDDGAFAVLGASDQIIVFDGATGQVASRIRTEYGRVDALAVSPDNAWIASVSGPRVDVWHRESGRRLDGGLGPYGGIRGVFAQDGKLIATGADGTVWRWNVDGSGGESLGPGDYVTQSEDGARWLWAHEDIVRVFDAGGTAPVFEQTIRYAEQLALNADGSEVLVGFQRTSARFSVSTGRRIEWAVASRGENFAVLSDGRVVSDGSPSRVFDADCTECEGRALDETRPGNAAGFVGAVLVGGQIATAGGSGPVRLYDASSLELEGCWNATLVDIAATDSRLVGLTTFGEVVVFPSQSTRRCRDHRPTNVLGTHPTGAHIAIDGDVVITAGRDGRLIRWNNL